MCRRDRTDFPGATAQTQATTVTYANLQAQKSGGCGPRSPARKLGAQRPPRGAPGTCVKTSTAQGSSWSHGHATGAHNAQAPQPSPLQPASGWAASSKLPLSAWSPCWGSCVILTRAPWLATGTHPAASAPRSLSQGLPSAQLDTRPRKTLLAVPSLRFGRCHVHLLYHPARPTSSCVHCLGRADLRPSGNSTCPSSELTG